jgi:predicted regulator of amino acid metabolism with ACT domain
MIGVVSTTLGDRDINISDIHVGVSPAGESALMVLALDASPPPDLLEQLRAASGIRQVSVLT